MASLEKLIKEYYSTNRDKMIDCPLQPGNLKITKRACLKRIKSAQKKKFENPRPEDLFNYFVYQGLLRCQQCPIIKTGSPDKRALGSVN